MSLDRIPNSNPSPRLQALQQLKMYGVATHSKLQQMHEIWPSLIKVYFCAWNALDFGFNSARIELTL